MNIVSINNDENEMTVTLGATVTDAIDELFSTDGSTQSYNFYPNDEGSPDYSNELTESTALATGQWLVVTAEDGVTYAIYEITALPI